MAYGSLKQHLHSITNETGAVYDDNFINNINFLSLKNIYNPSLYISSNFTVSAFEYYVQSRKQLRETTMLLQWVVNPTYFPKLSKSVSTILVFLQNNDFSDNIIWNMRFVYEISENGTKTRKVKEQYLKNFDEYAEQIEKWILLNDSLIITSIQYFYENIKAFNNERQKFKEEVDKVIL